jgi:transcription termination factor NusB
MQNFIIPYILVILASGFCYYLIFYSKKYEIEIIDLELKDDYYFLRLTNGKIKAVHKSDDNLSHFISEWQWLRIKEINRLNELKNESLS